VTVSPYRSANLGLVLAPVVTSSVMAAGILKFGAAPVLALCALLWLIVFFFRRPLLVALLWFAVLLYEEIVHDVTAQDAFIGPIGPILLLPMDIPYFFTLACLLISAVLQPREMARVFKASPFLTLFLFMVIASVVIDTSQYGKMAIGEARKVYFYFFFPILAAISIRTFADLHRLLLAVFFVAVSVSILGYLLLFMGPAVVRSTMRPISAGGALILLFTIFAVLVAHANNMAIANWTVDNAMAGLFLPLIIIAHHRTVFVAAALGLFLMVGLHRHKVLLVLKAALTFIIVLAVICVAFTKTPAFKRMFVKAIAGIADPYSDQTGSWRIEGWRQQLTPLSASELLFGKGLGSYYRWYNGTQEVTAVPHNAYVTLVLKFGLLGLAVYGLFACAFFRRMFAIRKALPPGPPRAYVEMSLLNVGGAHAVMIGYDFSAMVLVFFAIGITAAGLFHGKPDCSEETALGRSATAAIASA
jgi:O-antigen ligase